MMVIRPVERSDVSALMQLASKTGGGLTSLPACLLYTSPSPRD